MLDAVRAARPRAAKDVSMAGIVGTAGMLAEASGCGAELDVAAIPRPARRRAGDWLTCFPGFAMVTATRARAAAARRRGGRRALRPPGRASPACACAGPTATITTALGPRRPGSARPTHEEHAR